MRSLKPLKPTEEVTVKRIRVDWQELEDAFRDDSDEHRYYLDRDTGAVHFFSMYLDNEEEEEDERHITSEARYVLIPHGRRLVPLRQLKDFVSGIDDERDRRLLRAALLTPQARVRFHEMLEQALGLRDDWRRFVRAGLEGRIKDWLAEVGVEPLE